ncbi:phospholipase D gamma 1-like [Homarus americanus]|uniref:phospholipase D n=1 Tax=Homarus americanus TaxID=6706 RepID=A0A8J5MTJ1_HOMAM|nr:phospholipase D gamma 1-like [Homarus americanus]XP_042233234.1 phospholipase D gamma 1-like [Homarus americanus]KAG7162694.1 Phospholipase D delta-like [Homarus americanus]
MVVLCGRLEVVVVEACNLPNLDQNVLRPEDKSDPYCLIEVQTGSGGLFKIGKTFTIDDCLNPKWYFKVAADVSQDVAGLRFTVKDRDLLSSETIGSCILPVHTFVDSSSSQKAELPLVNVKGFQAGTLKVAASFTPTTNQTDPSFGDRAWTKASELKERMTRKIPRYGDTTDYVNSFGDMAFLHGVLDLKLACANNLPNLDSSILSISKKDVSDPFVVVSLEDVDGEPWKVATTQVIDNDLSPVWDENFRVDVCHDVSSITFTVRDKDFISSEQIGSVSFPVNTLTMENGVSGTYDLLRENKNKRAGTITLSVIYQPKHAVQHSYEVPDCLFPLRKDNEVRLYQDTHCPSLPLSLTDNYGNPYLPRSTWKDIYTTIMEATQFIYIVGWSVSAKIALLREDGEDNRPLGEMLKQKAFEGVRVRLLLWDEITSNDLRKTGAMSTEDEETLNFFRGTPVVVVLAPRDRHSKDMFSTKTTFTSLCYTHHQKCVIADAPIEEMPGKKKVVAFVGGLDLTGGRYDSPRHPLFSTLVREHKNDFRNRVFPTLTSASGPREPWHDIHSRVEGPAAHDVLMNFLQRWRKQAADHMESIIPLNQMDGIVMDYTSTAPDRWNVQIFRSINSDSAEFDWSTVTGLTKKKGRAFDNSLHRAYIHNIRRARRCIYIENQYFIGSSHMWPECRDAKAGNLVPLEIATKIEEKIKDGERFVAYICIPMFPEGKPADKVTQEILHWQLRTMQMMYSRVAAAIKQAGIDAHPQDYLLFLCLGKKESPEAVPSELVAPEDPSMTLAFANRRLMIYVHSKMAIFDDEYIIVGSANINDRSLSGNRDTEIATGSYQPMHTGSGNTLAQGDVSMFRRSLWAEHLGEEAPVDADPSSVECVRTVHSLAEQSLRVYLEPGDTPTPRNMLLYPLQINSDGTVTPRPECPIFPDAGGSVMGARSKVFPSTLTT